MWDGLFHLFGQSTPAETRYLREQTPGTWEYARAVEAAMTAAGYDGERIKALRGGLVAAQPLSVYRAQGRWFVDEWPYDRASVLLEDWQPSAQYRGEGV